MKAIFIFVYAMLFFAAPLRAEDEFNNNTFAPGPTNFERRREKRRPPPPVPVEGQEAREDNDRREHEREREREREREETQVRQNSRRARDEAFLGRETPWWNARACTGAVGFEASSPGSTSLLGSGSVIYGTWFSEGAGIDFYFGMSRTAGTATSTSTVAENPALKTRTTTTVYSGLNNPLNFTVGAYLKFRLYSNPWFALSFGPQVGISPPAKATSTTGTEAVSVPNTDDTDDFTTTQTTYGTIVAERGLLLSVGPKIGAEFYLKWIPHLAVGMSTGILAVLGGTTTTTTTTANKTITTTNGVPSDPGSVPSTTQTVTTTRGLEANTFGLGGTTFSFVGTFTIRYIF